MPGAVDSFQDIDAIQRAAVAERACFDMIFMGDNLYADPATHPSYTARLEPLTRLAAVAATTRHIGLGATMALRLVLPILGTSLIATGVSWAFLPDAPTYTIPLYPGLV